MEHGLKSLSNYMQSWHSRCSTVSRIVSLESEKEKCWRDKSCLGEWEDSEKQDMTQRPWEKVKSPPLPQDARAKAGLSGCSIIGLGEVGSM